LVWIALLEEPDREPWAAWLIGMDGGLGARLTEDAANGATGGG
jgi:hypothetical protein